MRNAKSGFSLATLNITTRFLADLAAAMTLITAASIAVAVIAFRPAKLTYPPFQSPLVCSRPTLELNGDRRVRCLLAVYLPTKRS